MTRKQILASLNKIANELDNNGLYTEANSLTNIMKRLAEDFDPEYDLGGPDPEAARKFDEEENGDTFMTKDYTLILRNHKYNQEIMRVPASN